VATALVIENDPTDDLRRLGDWLTEGGLEQRVLRPYDDDQLPEDLSGYDAFVVMGGEQRAYPDDDGGYDGWWLPKVEGLLRKAVRTGLPTLGICLGAQLLATAHAGTAERSASGPEIGPALVAKRDAADRDPLFRWVPIAPDVLQWHSDEITELPRGATLLAASTYYPNQAFRLGERAWGLQFHIECDEAMIADWAAGSTELAELGLAEEAVVGACASVLPDLEDVWQPFAIRFAALAQGDLDVPRTTLPLLGG
jgi:GMP synthase-like glutamine amidotransferase